MDDLSESLEVNLSVDQHEDYESRGSGDSESDKENEEEEDEEPNFWILGTSPLSDELIRLEEEHRRQIEEARQWMKEEEDADEMIRRDLEELQIAEKRNHELSARLIAPEPEVPPEVQERLDNLEKTVQSLQEQLSEKGAKLSERNENYSALLAKFNSMTDRLLNTDKEFKQTLSRVKTEYEELEDVLKGKMKTYQELNKHLELTLNQKEEEVSDLKEKLADYETMKSSYDELRNQLEDANKSVSHLNKMTIKLKERLKILKTERDTLVKEKDDVEPIEPLKQRIAELEAERSELLEERKKFEDVELLKNRVTLLEEEKGNLQLQLVDLDELKDSAESTKLLCESLEREKIDLECALSMVKAENAELLKNKDSFTNVSIEQETVIAKLKDALQLVTDEKVASVMKSVELEETLNAKEKEIANLKDSLRMVEAEKAESLRQVGTHSDNDSELMSDYNMSNGLQVKMTVLENELYNYRERERALAERANELQESRDELEAKFKEVCSDRDSLQKKIESVQKEVDSSNDKTEVLLAERDRINVALESQLAKASQCLSEAENQCAELREQLSLAIAEKDKLVKALSERNVTKETAQPVASTSDADSTTQKLKKLAAMYKKKCGELENEIEQLKATLNKKNDDCSMLASERSCLEHDVLNQASRFQQTFNDMQRLESELSELYSFVNEFKNVDKEALGAIIDPRLVYGALAMLSSWSSRTGISLPASSYIPQSSALSDDINELKRTLSEKESAIQELEKDKNELSDLVSANQQELALLKELYEKEAAKNEQFFTDLMGLESEMSQSKTELLARLEEVTSALRGRENYIEILEQDIVNMKTKMFSIESGMDDKHRELKDRAQLMMSKLEEAELMSQTFDKYKGEVEKKMNSLEESEKKMKNQFIDAQVALEGAQEEIEATRLRNSNLEKENEDLKAKSAEMLAELGTLRDIRNAYNNTLDTIEELNGGLKEAMDGFVAKSEKLNLLESERQVLINKLTDLEDAFGDLEKKLEHSEGTNFSLRGHSEMLVQQLKDAQTELDSLRLNQAGNDLLQKEMSELTGSYDEKISVLEASKKKLEELLFCKNDEVNTLQSEQNRMETEIEQIKDACAAKIAEIEASSRAQIQSAFSQLESMKQFQHQVGSSIQSSQTSPLSEASRRNVTASGESFENPFDDEEDGWGWSGGEAAGPIDAADVLQESPRITELLNSIQSLRNEKNGAVEELEAMKLNFKKVLKKLKDMKAEKTKATGLSDLDLVVQEELRGENDNLQGKVAELTKQLDLLKKEKEMLSKRLDTLVSANEQLIDMKERQDIEVQMWQKRSSELTNQVQSLQWSIEGMSSDDGSAGNTELMAKFSALVAENEELKTILNRHRDEMEQALAREQDLEQEILDLKRNLSELEKSAGDKVGKADVPLSSAAAFFQQQPGIVADGQQLKAQIEVLLSNNNQLASSVEKKDQEIKSMMGRISALEEEIVKNVTTVKGETMQDIAASAGAVLPQTVLEGDPEREQKLEQLSLENEKLASELDRLKDDISQRASKERNLLQEIDNLKNQVALGKPVVEEEKFQKTPFAPTTASLFQPLPSVDANLQGKLGSLVSENEELRRALNNMQSELSQVASREQYLVQEIENLRSSKSLEGPLAAPPVQSAATLFQGSASSFVDVFDSFNSAKTLPTSAPLLEQGDFTSEISRLTMQIQSLNSEKLELQQRLDSMNQENARLQKQIEEGIGKMQGLENQVSSQKAYFDEQVKELEQNFQKALLERDEDNAHLVCTISAKEQALNNATKELQSVREQYKNVAAIQEKLADYERENSNLRSELDGLKSYLEVSREAAENEQVTMMGPLKNQISILEEAKAKITTVLQSKEAEIQSHLENLKEKELQLQNLSHRLQLYQQEVEHLKSQERGQFDESDVLAEIDRLSAIVGELQTTVKNQQEQLSDKDRIILELQNEIRILQSVQDSSRGVFVEEGRLQYSVDFLEKERQRLENLVQDRLSEVAKYDEELSQLKNAVSPRDESEVPVDDSVLSYVSQIKEKDLEINRLTKAVVEIQERLLLSEQGKLNPDLKVVQNKLDQALYALHTRDLKIEEMTLEIMQLLEERDSLQFRLSDALRRSAEPTRENPKSPIHEKLSELHAAYKKDPLVQTEREARHAQQMQLYSENPPSTTEDNAPDYGFFNWFFGGSSTPSSQLGVNDGS